MLTRTMTEPTRKDVFGDCDPGGCLTPEVRQMLFQASEIVGDDLFDAERPPQEIVDWLNAASRPQLCGLLLGLLARLK